MKKILFLLGFVGMIIGNLSTVTVYSMSSKKMTEVEQPQETVEGLGRLKKPLPSEVTVEEKEKAFVLEELKQPQIKINEQNIMGLYNEFSDRKGEPVLRTYPASYKGDYFEMYTGEILEVEGEDYTSVRVTAAPYMSHYETFVRDGVVYFETYYQGSYKLEVGDNQGKKREIRVGSKHKYSFTEKQNYDIILNSYKAKNLKVFVSSKNLFELSFPDSFQLKDLEFLEVQLNIEQKQYISAREGIEKIRRSYILTEKESESLILFEEKTLKSGSETWEDYVYKNRKTGVLNTTLLEHLYKKKQLEERDLEILKEKYRKDYGSKEAQLLGDHYAKTGNTGEAIKYLSYAKDYEELAVLYLESRDLESFNETIELVAKDKRNRLISMKREVLEAEAVERELNLGRSKFKSDNYQEAILFFERAQKRDGKISGRLGVELDLGKSYYNLSDYKKAIDHLKRVRTTSDDSYMTLEADYYTAMSYYRGETRTESLSYFEKIVKDYPETSWAKKSMIYIIRLRKEIDKGDGEWKSTLTE